MAPIVRGLACHVRAMEPRRIQWPEPEALWHDAVEVLAVHELSSQGSGALTE